MPSTTDKQTDQTTSTAMTSANQLWAMYGQPLGIPFKTWINTEVMKAKATGIYKDGMNINDIVNGNRAISSGTQQTDQTTSASGSKDDSSGKQFKLMGVNGYVMVVVAVIGLGALIYWGSGKLVKANNA